MNQYSQNGETGRVVPCSRQHRMYAGVGCKLGTYEVAFALLVAIGLILPLGMCKRSLIL